MHNLIFDPPPHGVAAQFNIYVDMTFGSKKTLALGDSVVRVLFSPELTALRGYSLVDAARDYVEQDDLAERSLKDLALTLRHSWEEMLALVLEHSAVAHKAWLVKDARNHAVMFDAWNVLRARGTGGGQQDGSAVLTELAVQGSARASASTSTATPTHAPTLCAPHRTAAGGSTASSIHTASRGRQ